MKAGSANQGTSGRDVFVSYASQDVTVANSVVEYLEQHGIKCWIAPRDVRPGALYADAIVRAINDSKALVLVLEWGFMAGTVNPTTHDRVSDGGVMDADVSGRRRPR
jgi:hypothetical protein